MAVRFDVAALLDRRLLAEPDTRNARSSLEVMESTLLATCVGFDVFAPDVDRRLFIHPLCLHIYRQPQRNTLPSHDVFVVPLNVSGLFQPASQVFHLDLFDVRKPSFGRFEFAFVVKIRFVKRRKLAQQHRLDVAGASASGSMG